MVRYVNVNSWGYWRKSYMYFKKIFHSLTFNGGILSILKYNLKICDPKDRELMIEKCEML